jgi:hypothetical protein
LLIDINQSRRHLNRCLALLDLMKDPLARKTIADLIAYLESKLAAMDERQAANLPE